MSSEELLPKLPSKLTPEDLSKLQEMCGERDYVVGFATTQSEVTLNFVRAYHRRRTAECEVKDMRRALKPFCYRFIVTVSSGQLEWFND